jgi:hypothetical protein
MTELAHREVGYGRRGGRSFTISQRWRSLFRIEMCEASLVRRGFAASDDAVRRHLEHIGETFLVGFNEGLLAGSDMEPLGRLVEAVSPDRRGFAVEGLAMGAALADSLTLGNARLRDWMRFSHQAYTYLAHVGAGWALSRVPWRRRAILRHADPVHGWLVFDGLGFHDGYFYPRRLLNGWRRKLIGYSARAYDQGLGRALWFVSGGDPLRAVAAIEKLPSERRPDLWSGLGLALVYAGGSDAAALSAVRCASGRCQTYLAQGAAFGAEAHARAAHVPDHAAQAVNALAARHVETAVRIVRHARDTLPAAETSPVPRYELWRLAVQKEFAT